MALRFLTRWYHRNMKQLLLSILVSVLFFPATIFAQSSYSTLIDGTPLSDTNDIGQYLNSIYLLAIVAAALFAVVKIIIAGVKYMLSDVVTSKEDAKKDIRTSLLGLIIIISAVLILNTINPNLTDFDLKFIKPEKLSLAGAPPAVEFDDWEAPGCVRKGASTQIGLSQSFAINVSDCDEETKRKAIEDFQKMCSEVGTFKKSSAEFENQYTCSTKIAVEQWPISEYADGTVDLSDELAQEFLSYDENVAIFRSRDYCIRKLGSTSLPTDVNQCVADVSDAFQNDDDFISAGAGDTYCENNAGKAESEDGNDVLRCRLPVKVFTYDEIRKEVKKPSLTVDEFKSVCAQKKMEFVTTYRFWRGGSADYVCASYR